MKNKKLLTGVFAALIIPMAVYILFILLRPSVFFRADVIYLLLIQSLESVILGWGMSFGMISGNMDMSLGAEVTLGAIVGAIAAKYFGIPGIVIGALGTTVIVGSIKSMILRIIKTSSMVISIAYCLIIGALGSVGTNALEYYYFCGSWHCHVLSAQIQYFWCKLQSDRWERAAFEECRYR